MEKSNAMMKSVGNGEYHRTKVNININFSKEHFEDQRPSGSDDDQSDDKPLALQNNSSEKIQENCASASRTAENIVGLDNNSVATKRANFQKTRRIMSAPHPHRSISNFEELKPKKKTRKKKVLRYKDDENDSSDEFQERTEIKRTFPTSNLKATNSRRIFANNKSKSMMGSDQLGIETMVSILNLDGSDSDKEDFVQICQQHTQKSESTVPRIKTNILRKTVSFQDDKGPPFLNPVKNKIYNNNSYSSRVGSSKKPFSHEIRDHYKSNSRDARIPFEIVERNLVEDRNKVLVIDENEKFSTNSTKERSNSVAVSATDNDQTPKEQECWRLYEKMKKTGLNVSYDTILRGILKPSELRLLEKHKKRSSIEGYLSLENNTNEVEKPKDEE